MLRLSNRSARSVNEFWVVMLLGYFGFREDPFGVTPDSRFLYEAACHREALASLLYGIGAGRGFMALLAEPGMGKTSLLHSLLGRLHQSARTAFLFQTQCSSRELLEYLLADFEVESFSSDIVDMHRRLNDALLQEARVGRRCVAVIDEAQNLDHDVLESVRLLSDFETGESKLLQIVLAGQPALAEKLASPMQEQLRQRISSVNWLVPLANADVIGYIAHRLRVSGYQGPPLFRADASELIAEHSKGIPRNINNLCFNSLSLCCAEKKKLVEPRMVEEVLADLNLVKPGRASYPTEIDVSSSQPAEPPRTPPTATGPRSSRHPRTSYFPAASTVRANFGYSQQATARAPLRTETPVSRSTPLRAAPAPVPFPVANQNENVGKRSNLKIGTLALLILVSVAAVGFGYRYYPALTGHRASIAPAAPTSSDRTLDTTESISSEPNTTPSTTQDAAQRPSSKSEPTQEALNDAPLAEEAEVQPTKVPKARPQASLNPGMGSFNLASQRQETVQPPVLPLRTTSTMELSSVTANTSPAMPTYRPVRPAPPPARTPITQTSVTETVRDPVVMVRPLYPANARQANVSGEVEIDALVGTDGEVKTVKVLSGHPMLVSAATDAVRRWRFEPLRINGRTVEFNTRVKIRFTLSGNPNS